MKTMLFKEIICIKSPLNRFADRLSLLHTDAYWGTNREQLGNRYASTAGKEHSELYGYIGT